MSKVMVAEVRCAIHANDYVALRALHTRAKAHGIEHCDERQQSTVQLAILFAAMFKATTSAHTRTLGVMLDAIERGNHPYDYAEATASMDADAAIALASLDSFFGRPA